MAGHRDSRTRIYATLPSALKAPPHASPGQRPGFWERPITVRPERAQGSPSALSGRKRYLGHVPGASPRAGMLRALGASTSLSSRTEKTATKRYMSWALVAPDFSVSCGINSSAKQRAPPDSNFVTVLSAIASSQDRRSAGAPARIPLKYLLTSMRINLWMRGDIPRG